MKIDHIEFNGKKIVVFNWNQCQGHDELVQFTQEVGKEFKKSPEKLLTIDDFTEIYLSSEFMMSVKDIGKEVYAKNREKGAILGIDGIKESLLSSYLQFSGDHLIPFNSKEEALEYLAK